jgi:hypothetical protein
MSAILRILVLLACAIGSVQGFCQSLYYVESGNAACPARCSPTADAPTAVAPKKVRIGASVSGSISVSCGFGGGSYTVTLNSTDPGAKFSPKSFLVNFGSISGDGVFTVTFATAGVQTISAAITSNMGSPAVLGRFSSVTNEFDVSAADVNVRKLNHLITARQKNR